MIDYNKIHTVSRNRLTLISGMENSANNIASDILCA